jgi:hypothetical protein
MATSMATLRGLGCVPTFAGSSCVRRPAAARRAGAVARRTEARNGIASPLVGTGVRARRRGRPSVAPVAALGADAADALANIAPHVDAAATLAAARVAELADAAAALDASAFDAASGSSFADALDAVSGAASDAAEETGAQRMEGILSPISDRLEAFVLGTQALFEKQGVPYPLGSSIIFTTFVVKALTYPFTKSQVEATLNIQNLAPQTDAVREKYKDDPERMNIEINRLYEENQVSPLAGCVPILLTLPGGLGAVPRVQQRVHRRVVRRAVVLHSLARGALARSHAGVAVAFGRKLRPSHRVARRRAVLDRPGAHRACRSTSRWRS